MSNVLAIAIDSIRALLHKRILLAVIVGMLIMTAIVYFGLGAISHFVDPEELLEATEESSTEEAQPALTEAEQLQRAQAAQSQMAEILSVFYAFSAFGGIIVGIYIGASAVSSEINKGSIAMVLSRPVARWQFLLGKYVGAVVVLLGYCALIGAAMFFYTQTHEMGDIPALRYTPWLTFCHCLMIGSLALTLSMVMHPALAGVLAFFSDFSWLFSLIPSEGFLYYLSMALPSYQLFNVSDQFINNALVLGWYEVGMLTLYAFDLSVIFLVLAMWRLRYKEVS
ncbi:MAG: ABC transporter permease [Gammaproteobacteria bacterium]|nr:ABC transporter permease [Gammaproteobacteria bacterium]MYF38671.1 ABC transporter permease [Gammaproteobacteria bacterium]